MRASRLLTMTMLLQTRQRMTARELAEHLEVSERTVQRDVEALQAAGIPVVSTRGVAGGYRLAPGYRTRLSGLSPREAEAVAFLGLAGPAGELGLADVLGGARLKVLAGLTAEGRERAERVSGRFLLDTDRWFGSPEPTPALGTLAEALWEDRRVRVRHHRRGEVVERVLDPLGLVLKSEWYLLALRDGQQRTYRVSRLEAVEVLAERVRRPAGFDLEGAWRAHRAELERRRVRVRVRVRADPELLPSLRRVSAAAAQAEVPVLAEDLPRDGDGRVVVEVGFDGERWAVMALLGLGAGVEVLDPPHLRGQLAAEVAALAALYAGSGEVVANHDRI
ncbi:putative DNA-binding transcriptional regulator YafY [Kineococcus xinjiangensis]|uniref:Putative DNA-binding transcriptional regulator YafY n=1 Tax=Kineococcus xinjiangensis TaxID=512762 RepID=A0A2S6ID08_9ACTN|nr:WYL domain-containing protein [Kineococcus xinjiangensis]PPK92089.1 putative DNA-binding transcriptional regulator YafY [Kineococcus xinjiangensis]